MFKLLLNKVKESLFSVLPITILVLVLHFTICPLNKWLLILLLIGSIMLIIGMSLFSLGADLSLFKIGEELGQFITNKRKLWLLIIISIIVGIVVTIAEPDLIVLASQFSLNKYILISSVAVGVGIFLMFGLLRIVLQIRLTYILIGFYLLVFTLALIIFDLRPEFLAIAFDSGGVTTGPMTVPFILALGLGVANARGVSKSDDDSFGLVSLCSIGPILSVLILGLMFKPSSNINDTVINISNISEFCLFIKDILLEKIKEITLAMSFLSVFIFIFEVFIFKNSLRKTIKTYLGLVYVFIGLIIFLSGASMGFMPIGKIIGQTVISLSYGKIIIPIGMLIGAFVVIAEPAVHVLNKQVEEITAGSISKKMMLITLAIGVAISVGLSMLKIIYDFNILFILIPGYALAFILTIFTPKIFIAIAFDSGGVASGPITATFILPMSMGICRVLYVNDNLKYLSNSFGSVALVAMTPLIVIQLLGLLYSIKTKIKQRAAIRIPEEVIDFKLSKDILDYCES